MKQINVSIFLNYLLALAGVLLVLVGLYGPQDIIDALSMRRLGVYALIPLSITLWFGYEWKKIYNGIRDDEFDDYDIALTSRYMRMTFFVAVTMWSGLFLVRSDRFDELRYAFTQSFTGAKASFGALSVGLVFLLLFAATLYFVWKWFELRFHQ